MTRIKNGNILRVAEGLSELMADRLPAKLAFKLKFTAAAVDEQKANYTEVRNELLDRYAKRDDNGEKIVLNDATYSVEDGFFDELKPLNEEYGNEIPQVSAKEIIDFYDNHNLQIKASVLYNLGDILIDDVSEGEEDA